MLEIVKGAGGGGGAQGRGGWQDERLGEGGDRAWSSFQEQGGVGIEVEKMRGRKGSGNPNSRRRERKEIGRKVEEESCMDKKVLVAGVREDDSRDDRVVTF